MTRKNIVLLDNSREEMQDYLRGLEQATGQSWEAGVCIANGGRTSQWQNLLRYGKYFAYSFWIFLNRKKYRCIIGWQEFYGLVFAFWCRLFRVKKSSILIVKNLTYRPKKGWIGKRYFAFMRFIVTSGYVDLFTCCSQSHCDYCANVFDEPRERFCFVPFGVADFTKQVGSGEKGGYILSIGRSNRDWPFLIEALGGCGYPVRIVCDELRREDLPENFRIYDNVWQKRSYEFFRDCALVVLPILDSQVAAGETVLLQAMCFSKPVIAARDDGSWKEYITDGETGFVVPKDREVLRKTVKELMENRERYNAISRNCRREYEEKYSLLRYGENVGNLLKERLL